MLSQSIRDIFTEQAQKRTEQRREQDRKLAEQRRERDLKLAEQRREFDARMKDISKFHDLQIREQRREFKEELQKHQDELLTSRRWMIGSIITVGLSLTAYLSALIHFNH